MGSQRTSQTSIDLSQKVAVSEEIVQMVSGDAHNFILTRGGKLFSFGRNIRGECALGTSKNVNVAT